MNLPDDKLKAIEWGSIPNRGESVVITFLRMKFDVNDDGELEDIVVGIHQPSARVIFCEYADTCPFQIPGVTP